MSNDLSRFGKKDAAWLKENGFQMVPKGWAENVEVIDFYYWSVYKKLNKNLEIRLQYNDKKDSWSGWPLFPEALMQILDLNALSSEGWPDAENAFKGTMKDVNTILDAAALVKKSLAEESNND